MSMPFTVLPPSGLLCQLMAQPEKVRIRTARPQFCWIVNDGMPDTGQTAYWILVASELETLAREQGDMWDSGKVSSSQSLNVRYDGAPLASNMDYYWQVCTWNTRGEISPWSTPQHIRTGELSEEYTTAHYALEQDEIEPVEVVKKAEGHYFIDFGKAAFGTVRVSLACAADGHVVEVHLGEALASPDTIDRGPAGCIRYRKMALPLRRGSHAYTVEITPDERNTGSRAIPMPAETGEVMPFRYCEIVNTPSPVELSTIRQVAVHYPFDDAASSFTSTNQILNDVWDLCKYSIKATSFCGVYVDGDRERIPCEADSYINQLCHYAADREFTLARHTHEFMMTHATLWTEWILHSILMAWADYTHTGNTDSMERFYHGLKEKTLTALAREDGLISTKTGLVNDRLREAIHYYEGEHVVGPDLRDIVDWPPPSFSEGKYGERDGYEMVQINTVVNAFHYRALILMSRIATALDRAADAEQFRQRAERVCQSINDKCFDRDRGVYVDGEGSSHASLHANMFPLAFGLVPEEYRQRVVSLVKSRGMACSVYGAQFLLEALYQADEDTYALDLMTAQHDRSWWNMIRVGSTITMEAWDWKYKNNLDWNHAWGAAPANIIPRFLMGIRPLEPGFSKVLIRPRPGTLESAEMRLPTIRGTVVVVFESRPNESFVLDVEIPANVTARIDLPLLGQDDSNVMVDGKSLNGVVAGKFVTIDRVGSGHHTLERKRS